MTGVGIQLVLSASNIDSMIVLWERQGYNIPVGLLMYCVQLEGGGRIVMGTWKGKGGWL